MRDFWLVVSGLTRAVSNGPILDLDRLCFKQECRNYLFAVLRIDSPRFLESIMSLKINGLFGQHQIRGFLGDCKVNNYSSPRGPVEVREIQRRVISSTESR